MDISIFEVIGASVLLVGGICIGTIWGHRIPFIKKLAK